jgi:hypothetical protein
MTLISTLIFVMTSLLTTKPSKSKISNLTWSRAHWRRESWQLKSLTWYNDYRYQSAGLLALAIIIVAIWW